MNGTIVELRQILTKEPSAEVWDAIVAVLEAWDGTKLAVISDYLEQHLASWPDALLVAPELWLKRLVDGEDEPRLRWVRAVQVPERFIYTLPNKSYEAYKAKGFEYLSRLGQFEAFGGSKEQHMVWLCDLTAIFVNDCADRFSDLYPDSQLTFDMFAQAGDMDPPSIDGKALTFYMSAQDGEEVGWPSLVESAKPRGMESTRIESCELEGWKELEAADLEKYISDGMMQYTDDEGGAWNVRDAFSKADREAFPKLAQEWLGHIERAMGEPIATCCRVTLLCRTAMGSGYWTYGFLLRGPTKTAFLCVWYPKKW